MKSDDQIYREMFAMFAKEYPAEAKKISKTWVCKWCGTLNFYPGTKCDSCKGKRRGVMPAD